MVEVPLQAVKTRLLNSVQAIAIVPRLLPIVPRLLARDEVLYPVLKVIVIVLLLQAGVLQQLICLVQTLLVHTLLPGAREIPQVPPRLEETAVLIIQLIGFLDVGEPALDLIQLAVEPIEQPLLRLPVELLSLVDVEAVQLP